MKNLFVLTFLFLSSCVVYETDNRDHSNYSDVWFNDVSVYCEYDAVAHWSYWTLIAEPSTSGGWGEIDEVYVDIIGAYSYTYLSSFQLTPTGHGSWSYTFQNYGWEGNSYYCGSSYDFEFTAYDFYGNYIAVWYYW